MEVIEDILVKLGIYTRSDDEEKAIKNCNTRETSSAMYFINTRDIGDSRI